MCLCPDRRKCGSWHIEQTTRDRDDSLDLELPVLLLRTQLAGRGPRHAIGGQAPFEDLGLGELRDARLRLSTCLARHSREEERASESNGKHGEVQCEVVQLVEGKETDIGRALGPE